jgi:hypothetical protein
MQRLRAKREALCRQEEEARRCAHVLNLVREIYRRATMIASVTDRTQYVYPIRSVDEGLVADVVQGLRPLFPECTVSSTTHGEGAGIVVDWS